ncbi:MAG: hypothetical protein MUE70_13875 [Desulfobacterales bacterium]|jgi:hypothetical protein|nr:hypothetical protein [Desulfobacterales bacterium]
MNTKRIAALQELIRQIKEKILAIEQMRPGSLSEQFNVCGNPNCRCKDPNHPKKHGPYYQISYTRKGKSTTEFVRKEMLTNVKQELKAYQEFKKLTDEWIDLSIKIGKLRRQEYKKNKK